MVRCRSPLAALLARYQIFDVHGFAPLDTGLLNRSFEVRTGAGRYFLKNYLDQSPQTIRHQHEITTLLAGAGLPALAPIPDGLGRTLNHYGSRMFALYSWSDGRHLPGLELSLDQCTELGSTLGRLHEALGGYHPPIAQPLFQETVSAEQAQAKIDSLLRSVARRSPRDGFDDLAESRLIERRALIRGYADRRPPPGRTLTVGYVHGDFHGLNVFHDRAGAVRAVVDWDRLGVHPYVEELVRSALILFVDPVDGHLDLDRVASYVYGYCGRLPWLAAELPTGVHRLWWERLTDFWMLVWRYELGDPRTDVQFPGASALVVWWTHHYDKVLDAFTCAQYGRRPAQR
ncbi:MAG TPA: phosphotransferase [Actinocrinis sp.]|nr:phosphotransferase [Actinocrinis sp.]